MKFILCSTLLLVFICLIYFQLNILGHQFVAQHYYTVIICNNCQQFLYGICPQGYQCTVCLINVHRHCVKQFEDACPGPITKKESNSGGSRGIMKLIGMRHDSNDHNKITKKSNQFLQSKCTGRINFQISFGCFTELFLSSFCF